LEAWYEIAIELPGGYFIGVDREDGRIFLGEQIFRRGKYTGEIVRAGIKVLYWGIRKGETMKGVWDMKLLAQEVRLRVKLQGFSGFKLRAKIAGWIIRLGAWVAWFRIVRCRRKLMAVHDQCRTAVAEDDRTDEDRVKRYIIKSGNGYLVRIENDTPEMTTDPVSATRFGRIQAAGIAEEVVGLGIKTEIIEVRVGKYKRQGKVPTPEYVKVIPIQEGMVKKGGINLAPTTPRPAPPKGQGGSKYAGESEEES